MPLMQIEKWFFWDAEYSIISGTMALKHDGNGLLALAFASFVIIIPLAIQVANAVLVLLQLGGQSGGRLVAWLIEVNRWAMTDVFALAILVVVFKLKAWTAMQPLPGLYCFMAAVIVSTLVSIWIRRIYTVRRPSGPRRESA